MKVARDHLVTNQAGMDRLTQAPKPLTCIDAIERSWGR